MTYKTYRKSADADMNQIALRFDRVNWHTELDEEEQQTAHELSSNNQAIRKRVTIMLDYQTWACRMYLGGAQRTLAYHKTVDLTAILRFADMAKMHFWKYQVRGAHEPGDRELNFSPERAKADLQFEPEAIALLGDLEAHLKDIRAIMTAADREQLRKEEAATGNARPTLSRYVSDLEKYLKHRAAEQDQTSAQISARIDTLTLLVRQQDEQITRVNTFITQLLGAAGKGPVPA